MKQLTTPVLLCLLGAACTPAPRPVHGVGQPPAPPPMMTAPPAQPSAAATSPAQAAAAFVAAQTELLKPLQIESNRTWFQASVSGKDEDFAKSRDAENATLRFLADPQRFTQVKAFRADPGVSDPLVRRQLDVLYLAMLGKQVEPKLLEQITAIQTEVEQAFNTYRGKLDGKEVTQNEITKVLHESTDSKRLKAAWEAQKGVGPLVAPKLKQLVELRNEVAHKLGFRDFYALSIAENEQDEQTVLKLFDELDRLTRDAFLAQKAEVDRRLAKRLKLPVTALMPWHYQNPFFQEPPAVFDTGLDKILKQQDTLGLCKKFYDSIGLDTADILARSDLYEKTGKSPHAFSSDIDRNGDIRILANVVPGAEWQSTLLHELGHSVYSKYVDPSLPWLLRSEAHPLTTEGIAMMFEQLVSNPYWAEAMGVMKTAERDRVLPEARASMAFSLLQFSRWTQVMLHFERELYRDPNQDLSKLWWDLVEKYQGLQRPPGRDAPDYASKIHLVVAPVYYHNYTLGQLFAAQVHETIAAMEQRDPSSAVFYQDPKVGELLKAKVFAPGARLRWDELAVEATGKPLGPEAFARGFAKK
jgi:peptidyl-dipeptidase A